MWLLGGVQISYGVLNLSAIGTSTLGEQPIKFCIPMTPHQNQ